MPGTPNSDRNHQRHLQRHRLPHLGAHQVLERVALPRPDLEDQLIVHLEQHPTAQPKVVERGLLSPVELEAWLVEWEARAAEGASFVSAPTVADVILRKP